MNDSLLNCWFIGFEVFEDFYPSEEAYDGCTCYSNDNFDVNIKRINKILSIPNDVISIILWFYFKERYR